MISTLKQMSDISFKLYASFSGLVHGYLVRVEVFGRRIDNFSHERRVLDVFVVAEYMHGILPGLCGPVAHVTGSVTLVVTFDLGLRWTFHRET